MLQTEGFLLAKMGIGEAGITAVFGYATVFCGLLLLMGVLYGMGAIFKAKAKRDAAKAAQTAPPAGTPDAESAAAAKQIPAPGSAGHVKRFDVPDKEAAMLMAIVADQMQMPLNELHFISIKEVKEDEV